MYIKVGFMYSSKNDNIYKCQNITKNMIARQNVFLDYGDLIAHHDFNEQTLARAHRLVIDYLHERGKNHITLDALSEAHKKVTGEYLADRKETLKEWTMPQFTGKILTALNLRNRRSLCQDISDAYKAIDHDTRLMPETRENLDAIAGESAQLSIISNCPHDSIYQELSLLGIRGFFNDIVLSCEVGVRKPRPKIYQIAIKRAGIRPYEGVFFSHDQEEVDGALAVGMQAHLAKNLAEVLAKLKTS